jgi:hypothetical protein
VKAATCAGSNCDEPVPAGRRAYCSDRCKKRAAKQRERAHSLKPSGVAPTKVFPFQRFLEVADTLLDVDRDELADVDPEVADCWRDDTQRFSALIGGVRRRTSLPSHLREIKAS